MKIELEKAAVTWLRRNVAAAALLYQKRADKSGKTETILNELAEKCKHLTAAPVLQVSRLQARTLLRLVDMTATNIQTRIIPEYQRRLQAVGITAAEQKRLQQYMKRVDKIKTMLVQLSIQLDRVK